MLVFSHSSHWCTFLLQSVPVSKKPEVSCLLQLIQGFYTKDWRLEFVKLQP